VDAVKRLWAMGCELGVRSLEYGGITLYYTNHENRG